MSPTTKTKKDTKRRFGGPRPVAEAVSRLTGPAVRRRGLARATLLTDWGKIVGDQIALACRPERLVKARGDQPNGPAGGTLHLLVAGYAATEIQHLTPLLIERINGFFGYQAVADIRIQQGTLPAPPEPPAAAPAPDPADVAAVARTVAEVADADLKESLAALGRALAIHGKDTT